MNSMKKIDLLNNKLLRNNKIKHFAYHNVTKFHQTQNMLRIVKKKKK